MAQGVGGEGGARGGRDPNAGSSKGPKGGGQGGPKGPMGMGSFGGLPGQPTRDQMMGQDLMGAKIGQALRDYRGDDDSFIDKIGNFLAGLGGLNEMDPTKPGFSKPGMPGRTGQANWGWDPAAAIGGAAGLGIGFPGLGLFADQISAALGRPFEMNMGPSVFGSGGGRSAAPAGGGTGMGGGRSGAPHSTGNPFILKPPAPAPQPVAMPAKPAPMPAVSKTPYTGAVPMPGQVKLPQNYFLSQLT